MTAFNLTPALLSCQGHKRSYKIAGCIAHSVLTALPHNSADRQGTKMRSRAALDAARLHLQVVQVQPFERLHAGIVVIDRRHLEAVCLLAHSIVGVCMDMVVLRGRQQPATSCLCQGTSSATKDADRASPQARSPRMGRRPTSTRRVPLIMWTRRMNSCRIMESPATKMSIFSPCKKSSTCQGRAGSPSARLPRHYRTLRTVLNHFELYSVCVLHDHTIKSIAAMSEVP